MMNIETWFETHQNLMCHRLTDRIEVTTNLHNGVTRIFKDGNEIDNFESGDMSITEYERLVERTYNEAKLLQVLIK